jgi:hypothetical protein
MMAGGGRKMTLLDAILLVGSAAVGLGLFELSHRMLFKSQIWLADQGVPNVQSWSTIQGAADGESRSTGST